VNTDRRNIQRALNWLVEHGYLYRSRNRKSGAGYGNTYEMRFPALKGGLSTPLNNGKGGPSTALMNGQEGRSGKPTRAVYKVNKGGLSAARTLEEPLMNLRSAVAAAREGSLDSGGSKEASSRQSNRPSRFTRPRKSSSIPKADFRPARFRTTFPPDLKLGATHAAVASRIVGWDRERALKEFEKCRVWNVDHGTRQVNWDQTWKNWCVQGKVIDARNAGRDAAHQPRQKGFEAASGLYDLIKRRRARASAAQYVSEPEHVTEGEDDNDDD
jgi:hypothetical protein